MRENVQSKIRRQQYSRHYMATVYLYQTTVGGPPH